MGVYFYKVDLYDNEKDRNHIAQKRVIIEADSTKEASRKLYQHYSEYYIRHYQKGVYDELII